MVLLTNYLSHQPVNQSVNQRPKYIPHYNILFIFAYLNQLFDKEVRKT